MLFKSCIILLTLVFKAKVSSKIENILKDATFLRCALNQTLFIVLFIGRTLTLCPNDGPNVDGLIENPSYEYLSSNISAVEVSLGFDGRFPH